MGSLKIKCMFLMTSSGVFIVNFEHISYAFLVFLLMTLNKKMLARQVRAFRLYFHDCVISL